MDSKTREEVLKKIHQDLCRYTGKDPNEPFQISEEEKRKNREQIKRFDEMRKQNPDWSKKLVETLLSKEDWDEFPE